MDFNDMKVSPPVLKPNVFDAAPWSLQFQVFCSCQLADALIQGTYNWHAAGAGIKDTQHAQGHWLIRIQTKNPWLPSQVSKTAQLLIVYPMLPVPAGISGCLLQASTSSSADPSQWRTVP